VAEVLAHLDLERGLFGLITCMAVFKPVFCTYRLDQVLTDRVALTLSAWSVTSGRPSPR
jgi:hypothetical protein